MNFSAVFDYLVGLQRSGFTGAITIRYTQGEASNKVEVKHTELIKEKTEDN
jgi:hypothetical protein